MLALTIEQFLIQRQFPWQILGMGHGLPSAPQHLGFAITEQLLQTRIGFKPYPFQ